jgi:hypothetical protein
VQLKHSGKLPPGKLKGIKLTRVIFLLLNQEREKEN